MWFVIDWEHLNCDFVRDSADLECDLLIDSADLECDLFIESADYRSLKLVLRLFATFQNRALIPDYAVALRRG